MILSENYWQRKDTILQEKQTLFRKNEFSKQRHVHILNCSIDTDKSHRMYNSKSLGNHKQGF